MRLRQWFEGLGTAPGPALGVALAVAVFAWLVLSSEGGPLREETAPSVAERNAGGLVPSAVPDAVLLPAPEETRIPQRPEGLAEVKPPSEVEADGTTDLQLADTNPPATPSGDTPLQTLHQIEVDPNDPTPIREVPHSSGPDEILIAANDWSGGLDYIAPSGGVGRMDLVGRGGSGAPANPVQLVAPASHSGRVASATPMLFWALRADESHAIEIQIVDERAIDPVLRLRIDGPHKAGLHGIDLAEYALQLDSDVPYVWSVAIVVDEERPARNPRSQATIVPAGINSTDAAAVRATPATERIEAALGAGFWYDGIGELARVAAARPGEAAISMVLGDLLSGESLPRVAAEKVVLHRPTDSIAR